LNASDASSIGQSGAKLTCALRDERIAAFDTLPAEQDAIRFLSSVLAFPDPGADIPRTKGNPDGLWNAEQTDSL